MNFTEFGRELVRRSQVEVLPVLQQFMPHPVAMRFLNALEPVASRKHPKTSITGEQLHDTIAASISSKETKERRAIPVLTAITNRRLIELETEKTRVEPRTLISVRPDLTAVERNSRLAIDYKMAWKAPRFAPFRAAMQVAVGWSSRWIRDGDALSARGEIWYVHPETGKVTVVEVPHLEGLIRSIPSLHNLVNPPQNGKPGQLN